MQRALDAHDAQIAACEEEVGKEKAARVAGREAGGSAPGEASDRGSEGGGERVAAPALPLASTGASKRPRDPDQSQRQLRQR